VLRDGDDDDIDCPVRLAELIKPEEGSFPVDVQVVIAFREYEAWFLASADSLRAHSAIRDDAASLANPEGKRNAKRELEKLMLESYKETLHQAKFSALMDLNAAAKNSRSFRRMIHAVEILTG
jgi:hypothetical protein